MTEHENVLRVDAFFLQKIVQVHPQPSVSPFSPNPLLITDNSKPILRRFRSDLLALSLGSRGGALRPFPRSLGAPTPPPEASARVFRARRVGWRLPTETRPEVCCLPPREAQADRKRPDIQPPSSTIGSPTPDERLVCSRRRSRGARRSAGSRSEEARLKWIEEREASREGQSRS